jgi:hypothetical protein
MARTMAIGKLVCTSFQNPLIVGKLLKLVELSQRIQILSLQMKETHDFLMIKPSMLYLKRFHRLNLVKFQTMELLKKHDNI